MIVEGARQNNLKNISLRIPHNKVTAITGVSGSGKSSLAFDTLFAEGQWRYVESLSTYARMFLEKVDRPDVDRLVNVRPAIAIEQKNPVRTARSTVGTATEIADLLRLLFAKIGKPVCPDCRQEARGYHPGSVADDLLARFSDGRAMILFPVKDPGPGHDRAMVDSLLTRGFVRLKCGDDTVDLHPSMALPRTAGTDLHVVLDRLVIRPDNRNRIIEAIETAFREGDGLCRVEVIGQGLHTYSTKFRCQSCGRTFEPLRPILFSFNHPLGACPECKGFGNILKYDEDLVIPNCNLSLADGAVEPWTKPGTDWWQKQMLLAMKRKGVDLTTPYAKLSGEERALIWKGDKKFDGIDDFFKHLEQKRYKLHVRVFLSRYRSPVPCPLCHGSRLKPDALFVKVADRDIHQIVHLTIHEAAGWIEGLPLSKFEAEVAHDIRRQLRMKLGFLLRVGLGYLTLARQTKTLSGGEAQRITLANQLGARLVGTLYVLDEPTIGLHARDTATLAGILRDLADSGNTVVVVEHDRQMIQAADYVIEMGPRSGERGGEVVCAAPCRQFIADPRSLTGRYLRGEETIAIPRTRRSGSGRFLSLAGAREHNLKDLNVRFPLGMLICVTGVSGSGKSTLVDDTLYRAAARAFRLKSLPMGRFTAIKGLEYLKSVRLIDQEPIGRTPRSNPITYLKAFDDIRALFANTQGARTAGLTPAHFSFNTPGGRCERCEGNGYEKLEMYFFEDLYATCETCGGRRFGQSVLNVRYRDKTIHEVLGLTVNEALTFFSGSTRLGEKLHLLASIGLGYLRLGQPATTLSGGEAQRLKIAAELNTRGQAPASGRSQSPGVLYIMDEPTTGLHLDDIKKLLAVLGKLVDTGNTVVVVEHNLDMIKAADWIIDLGPEGGEQGGRLVAEGRPEQVAQVAESHTGRFLKAMLEEKS
ncbi:MAG: excinuclease ABC subunit A [Nitrospirae bacterium RIFCSPLOWO2_02_FULL_62_14]|nr:MAG: excinuclease ABC subunit A [Nitrospirae bacterium RIFCSPLOWO2_02_FULL_62_14]